jgi:UDP-hydrolysing UDP-N-acetyl-D-glucosamine 2-epimerase
MRSIGVVTGSRADYSIYLPVLRAIKCDRALQLILYVTGMHLSRRFGLTVTQIEADGFGIAQRIETVAHGDEPHDIARSIAAGIAGFSNVFARRLPDILLVLGDRYEMLAAVIAALPFNVPIAHIAGGEVTEGAMDDVIRHSISKMAHLHFTSTEDYRFRVIQMGEEPWRVTATGNPSLDNLRSVKFLRRKELESALGISLHPAPLLITYHPVTREYEQAGAQAAELIASLDGIDRPIVITAPNSDTHRQKICRALEDFARSRANTVLVPNLGMQKYFSLMKLAACMVGNSSSGLCEAASFELPVVNLGDRQKGRIGGKNVLQVACNRSAIHKAVLKALSAQFRASLKGMQNPEGDGHAAERIVKILKTVPVGRELLWKKFRDLPVSGKYGRQKAR